MRKCRFDSKVLTYKTSKVNAHSFETTVNTLKKGRRAPTIPSASLSACLKAINTDCNVLITLVTESAKSK